ncbi:XYPPX repeat protein [Teladorsagia circumcincta]|uniref:Rhodopsin n=1 Tax=Teladorsagia circumcincta TaxID=45464 RepID=A0A2G9V1T6_TELCI|nr:XYPPX repeat protein [Teladorsagia circumcincta]
MICRSELSGEAVRAKRAVSNITLLSTTPAASPTTMEPDKILDSLQYKNGTRPQVITWACRRDVEECCGTECCPANGSSGVSSLGIVIMILALVALVLCYCGLAVYAWSNGGFFETGQRRPINTRHSNYPRDDTGPYHPYTYPYQEYPPQGYAPYDYPPYGYPPQYYAPEGYPPDAYPPEGYPPQGYPPEGYPPQGYPPQGYPPKGYSREDSPAEDSHPKKRRSRSRESDRSGGHPKGQKITNEIIKLKGKEQKPNMWNRFFNTILVLLLMDEACSKWGGGWRRPSEGWERPSGGWGRPPGRIRRPGRWGGPHGGVMRPGGWGRPPGGVIRPGRWGSRSGMPGRDWGESSTHNTSPAMWNRFFNVILVLLLTDEVCSKWGGGWGRPSGGWERPSGGWGRPPGRIRRPGGWGRPHGGVVRPGGWGRLPGGVIHPGRSGSRSGMPGPGWGMLAFEAGRAIIQSMTTSFSHNGRDYYFDNHPHMKKDLLQCTMLLEELKLVS